MNALTLHAVRPAPPLLSFAAEPGAAWLARGLTDLVPPATLTEARSWRDELATLLSREREAAADFLLALADFDRRRGWERLGHASLFAFLTRELKLSSGAAQLRLSAARLLPRHPAVEEALRAGRLCISAVGQLARVLTPENEAEVLPRFFGLSTREAQEVVAAIRPDPAPPLQEVVRSVPISPQPVEPVTSLAEARPAAVPLHTCEVPGPARVPPPVVSVEPLTADLRRLHITVSSRFLEKVAKARTGLSHALPHATTEQVLEAALDLLLEQQALRKARVRNPMKLLPTALPGAPTPTPTSTPCPSRPPILAAVERAVRLRDGDRCQYPLDAGGVCGSTWQVELDHILPVVLGGDSTVANLRCCCRIHNRVAAEEALGHAAGKLRSGDRSSGRRDFTGRKRRSISRRT